MEGKLIVDLKVTELRRQLQVRNKDKSGVRHVLLDRLKQALIEEGVDPLTFKFADSSALSAYQTTGDEEVSEGSPKIDLDVSPTLGELCATAPLKCEQVGPPDQLKVDEPLPFVVEVEDADEDFDYDLKSEKSNRTNQDRNRHNEPERDDVDESTKESKKSPSQYNNEFKNLWISNIPKTTKAVDLKALFSKYGKVVTATVVMNTRTPRGCFGLLKMATIDDANCCIAKLNGAQFNGTELKVEATKKDLPARSSKKETKPLLASRSRRSFRPFSRVEQIRGADFDVRRALVPRIIENRESAKSRFVPRARVTEWKPSRLSYAYPVRRAAQVVAMAKRARAAAVLRARETAISYRERTRPYDLHRSLRKNFGFRERLQDKSGQNSERLPVSSFRANLRNRVNEIRSKMHRSFFSSRPYLAPVTSRTFVSTRPGYQQSFSKTAIRPRYDDRSRRFESHSSRIPVKSSSPMMSSHFRRPQLINRDDFRFRTWETKSGTSSGRIYSELRANTKARPPETVSALHFNHNRYSSRQDARPPIRRDRYAPGSTYSHRTVQQSPLPPVTSRRSSSYQRSVPATRKSPAYDRGSESRKVEDYQRYETKPELNSLRRDTVGERVERRRSPQRFINKYRRGATGAYNSSDRYVSSRGSTRGRSMNDSRLSTYYPNVNQRNGDTSLSAHRPYQSSTAYDRRNHRSRDRSPASQLHNSAWTNVVDYGHREGGALRGSWSGNQVYSSASATNSWRDSAHYLGSAGGTTHHF